MLAPDARAGTRRTPLAERRPPLASRFRGVREQARAVQKCTHVAPSVINNTSAQTSEGMLRIVAMMDGARPGGLRTSVSLFSGRMGPILSEKSVG